MIRFISLPKKVRSGGGGASGKGNLSRRDERRFAAIGTSVPVDYDLVGGVTNAVIPGSRVTDIVRPQEWYGLRM